MSPPNNQQTNFMDVLGSPELDLTSLQDIWSVDQPHNSQSVASDSSFEQSLDGLFDPWGSQVHVPATIKEEWSINSLPLSMLPSDTQVPLSSFSFHQQKQMIFPPTPPVSSPTSYTGRNYADAGMNKCLEFNSCPLEYVREITPPSSVSGNTSPSSQITTPPSLTFVPQVTAKQRGPIRRRSAEGHPTPARTYRRRASSHPSVASVVSLSAHEPVARVIDGIEYITFLYSHDRLVKEYTVRTDIGNVNLDEIPLSFRVQNAIYPRANVSREDYDGNRWDYETSCNKIGWQLCWLNQDELCGRRGLIQRAVDSYRNRHTEMRSRRVTRQEKVANGTLRKRRAKKANSTLL
ncbi:hypothetical protein K501DRAFT_327397 [Backusella circina FSU 941]|nr:hypothetical protein K501DRAFT_327397 [Backusella circina FSU 941]